MNTLPKILIVDDEPIIRSTLENLLATEEVELLFAENGETGLAMAREHQPDAIMLDVMMPGMDGYETCRQIRANPALAEVPIIIITALDDRNSRLVGLLAGADDFLTKPFDGFEIQVRLKNIMRLNRYRTLVAERSRFNWVVEHDDNGYLVLNEAGVVQYANSRAQIYFHLPEDYAGINFDEQAARYYQIHFSADGGNADSDMQGNAVYLVQPESEHARAFWLRMETLPTKLGDNNQRLMRVSDVTDKMSANQDVRKIHLLVAHKLRTPVSIIYSNMNLLNMKMDVIPEGEVKAMVKSSWQNSERLVREVHDILRYIDVPITLVNGAPFILGNLHELITTVGKALELIGLSVVMPQELFKTRVGISTTAVEMIVYELLENSKKFHPRETPQIEIRVEQRDAQTVLIQFLDDGQTMTAEQITRALQPYSQGEKWFTGEVPGMGLGIPTVAGLVWQAGGSFRIENRADAAGISIAVTLPLL